ncbi:MAG: ribonuclease HII [Proteobacteria bacterium]|nr:ribonuclease HII [Pseudomonadota bacterium]
MNLMNFELQIYQSKNHRFVGGIDEVGRGCLAGPLVTAIVVYDLEKLKNLSEVKILKKINQIKDSKKLLENKREELSLFIHEFADFVHINEVSNVDIDKLLISKSTNNSFLENYNQAKQKGLLDFVLTDAFKIKGVDENLQESLIKGDNTSLSIASASIVAKVYRDNLMKKLAEKDEFKIYEFEKHKGYGTAAHLDVIKKSGISTLHRKSFEPIKSMLKISS